MTKYNTLKNVKLSNLPLSKLKLGIKNSDDETYFFTNSCYLLLKFRDFVKLLRMVHQLKFVKTHLSKMIQLGESFLCFFGIPL